MRELLYIRNAGGSGVENNSKKQKRMAQQQQYQRCDSVKLTPDLISHLNQLSFPWKNNASQWQKCLDDFLHYRAKNIGECNVSNKFLEHPSLGNFVNRQRVEYGKMLNGKSTSKSGK